MTMSTMFDAIAPVFKTLAHTGCELAKDPQFQSTMMVGLGILTGIAVSKAGKKVGEKLHCTLAKSELFPKGANNQRFCKNFCSIGAQIVAMSAIGCFADPYFGKEIVSGMILSSITRAEWEPLNQSGTKTKFGTGITEEDRLDSLN